MAYSHFRADCTACGWSTEDNEGGPEAAEDHISETGHKVIYETGGRAGPDIINEIVSIHLSNAGT